MNHNGTTRRSMRPVARRTNGLSPEAPEPGRLILVTGGGGYIGSVLTSACSTAATGCGSSTGCTGAASHWRASSIASRSWTPTSATCRPARSTGSRA